MHGMGRIKAAPEQLKLKQQKSKQRKLAEVTRAISKEFLAKVKNAF